MCEGPSHVLPEEAAVSFLLVLQIAAKIVFALPPSNNSFLLRNTTIAFSVSISSRSLMFLCGPGMFARFGAKNAFDKEIMQSN